MDDGRETSVQTDMFLILTCNSFENYPLYSMKIKEQTRKLAAGCT